MKKYSKQTEDWLNLIRYEIESLIRSYHSLEDTFGPSAKKKYKDIRDYFLWSVEDQSEYGSPGPVEDAINEYWEEASKTVRNELGNSKNEAAKIAGILLKEEYGIDIIDEIKKNSDPCYALDRQAKSLDWELDFEEGYKRIKKILKNKDVDQGTALYSYWCITPDFYTQYENADKIKDEDHSVAFKLLKEIEQKLLNNEFKSNKILYDPTEDAINLRNTKWKIPEELCKPNIKI